MIKKVRDELDKNRKNPSYKSREDYLKEEKEKNKLIKERLREENRIQELERRRKEWEEYKRKQAEIEENKYKGLVAACCGNCSYYTWDTEERYNYDERKYETVITSPEYCSKDGGRYYVSSNWTCDYFFPTDEAEKEASPCFLVTACLQYKGKPREKS